MTKLQETLPSSLNKPQQGLPGSPSTSIVTPNGSISGNPVESSPLAPVDIEDVRMGDWYYDNRGVPHIVENSQTDLELRGTIVSGAAPLQNLTVTDYLNAAKAGATSALLGRTFGKIGAAAGAAYGFANSILDAKHEYAMNYLNQDVDVTKAYNIVENEDGTRSFYFDPEKMASASSGSGAMVKDITDTSKSSVDVGDGGAINIKVTTPFLESKEYQDAIDRLDELFPNGLTKEMASQTANEETGATYEEEIRRFILDEETDFYYKAKSIANFKLIAPNASDEALEQACNTQLAGYLKNKDLSKLEISVYDDNDAKKNMTALEFFTEINNLDKKSRNDYVLTLGNKIKDADISDDEKVILQAQANALYGASDNKESGFEGMLLDNLGDSLADANLPIFGRVGNIFGVDELEAFERNEFWANTIDTAAFAASLWATNKTTNLLEKGARGAVSKLGSRIGGRFGDKMANINNLAPQNGLIENAGTVLEDGTVMTLAQSASRRAAQYAMQAIADTGYDTIEWMAHKATGQDYDFLGQLQTDFLMDAIMSYGPQSFAHAMNSERYEYRKNKETGELQRVKLTAAEIVSKRAKQLLDATDGNAAIKTQELFWDKNAGISRMSLIARWLAPDDNRLFQKAVRYSGDIKAVTADEKAAFEFSSKDVQAHVRDVHQKVHDLTGGRPKNFTKADANYINAKVNRRRFVRMAGDDQKRKMRVIEHYKDAVNGIDKERAKQLDDLLSSMETVIRDTVDYYKAQGLLSNEEYDRMVNSDIYKNGEFFPVWSSKRNFKGGDIMQTRRAFAEVKESNKLFDIEDFDDPLTTFSSFINNQMRNIAIQRRLEVILQIASIPGSPIRVISDRADLPEGASAEEKAGAMGEVEMVKKYSEQFEKVYENVVKNVEKNVPTYEEWAKSNSDAIMGSDAMNRLNDLKELDSERKELRKELRRLQTEGKRIYEEGWTGDEMDKLVEDIDYVRFQLNRNRAERGRCIENMILATEDLLAKLDKKNKYGKKVGIPEVDLASLRIKEGVESALKSGNPYAAVQVFLNAQTEAVNPYISRESVIRARASEEAAKFRKKSIKEMRAAEKNNKSLSKRINIIADKALDKVLGSIRKEGARKDSGDVDTEDMSSFLATYDVDHPRTVRYYVDGVQHHVTLEGTGAEAMVAELYAPETTLPTTTAGMVARKAGKVATAVARGKRVLTTAIDVARVAPNLIRDWKRGIVMTGGKILLDPDALRRKAIESGKYSPEEIERINDAFLLVRNALSRSTFTQSLEAPKEDRARQMIIGSEEGSQERSFARRTLERGGMTARERLSDLPDYIRAGFIHFRTDLRSKNLVEKLSLLQDWAETYTRKRAMDTAYYTELSAAAARGESMDQQIESAMEAAYFAGREATVNFARRGKIIQTVAQFVPYLSQNYSSLESLKYAYLNDPIAVSNTMRVTVGAYSALIAIALSNEESRKRYYLLSEYDRANSIIIPITNDTIVTLPLDENVAAFLTPYRRILEALEGNDPSGFYLWGVDFLEALSPVDLSGFSEGDKFNLRRGLEKLAAQHIPTVLLPLLENATGRNWVYGNDIAYDAEKTGMYYDNPDPTAGEMTSRSKNSKILAAIADATGIPQWKLQNVLEDYGGNVGQYALNALDKLSGATEENTGGKDWKDAVAKPFTGVDSDEMNSKFMDGVNRLNEEKKTLTRKIKKIDGELEAASGEEKAELEQKRQKMITDYGLRVTDFVDQYLSAFEITGGLSQKEANTVYYLYDIHGEASNAATFQEDTQEGYYNELIRKRATKRTTALAAESGFGKYAQSALNPYHETYGYQALKNSIYGRGADTMAKVAVTLEDTSNYDNSYTKLRSDVRKRYDAAMDRGEYDTANAIAYEYDRQILRAIVPQLQEDGIEQSLKNSTAVTDYLEEWILVPTDYYKDAKGRWVSKLPEYTSKRKAYNRRFILDMFGLLDEEE